MSAPRTLAPLFALAFCACSEDSVAPGSDAAVPDAAAPVEAGPEAAVEAGPPEEVAPGIPAGCDFNGRWLVASRVLATALGQDQAAHNWFYYEIEQTDRDLLVKKGLHCGFEVVKKSALAASVDSTGAWPAFLMRNSSNGRRGSVRLEPAGCNLRFDREYVVRGATLPHYLDPMIPLPGRTQKAEGATPGWEDWDGDGNPGVSYKVTSSFVSGTVYVCQRDFTEYAGVVPVDASKFKLAVTYGTEQTALGRSEGSSELIEMSGRPASDASQHRVFFHRLADGQATGDDPAICAAVRELRNTLVPEAND